MSRLTGLKLESMPPIVPRFDADPAVKTVLMGPGGIVACVIPEPVSEWLKVLEVEITASEKTGLEARWNCGRELLKLRKGKKLPTGVLVEARAVTASELARTQSSVEVCRGMPGQAVVV